MDQLLKLARPALLFLAAWLGAALLCVLALSLLG